MNPASREYYHTLETLMEEVRGFKSQQGDLRFQVSKLFEENKRLTAELKETVMERERRLSESGYAELERKYQEVLGQKTAALELWQEALKQVEAQAEQLAGRKSLVESERSETGKLVEQMREEYAKGLNVLSNEVAGYRTDLLRATRELEAKTAELELARKEAERWEKEAGLCKKAIFDLTAEKAEAEDKAEALKRLLEEAEGFLSDAKREMAQARAENSELSVTAQDWAERHASLKARAEAAERDSKESLLTAQEAVLQRKEAAYREERLLKEVQHLKRAVGAEAGKAEVRFKAEVKELGKQAAERVEELMEEIAALHREVGDRQGMFERAVRERQALEAQLAQMNVEEGQPDRTFEDLTRRLTRAEKAAEEQELRCKALGRELEEHQRSREAEQAALREEQERSRSRLQQLQEDFERSAADRLRLSDCAGKLRRRVAQLERELRAAAARATEETLRLREDARRRQEALAGRLRAAEETAERAAGEARGTLEAERRICRMWKEELELLVAASEAKIGELTRSAAELESRNRELVGVLQNTDPFVGTVNRVSTGRAFDTSD